MKKGIAKDVAEAFDFVNKFSIAKIIDLQKTRQELKDDINRLEKKQEALEVRVGALEQNLLGN